jgi:hypothetical protein
MRGHIRFSAPVGWPEFEIFLRQVAENCEEFYLSSNFTTLERLTLREMISILWNTAIVLVSTLDRKSTFFHPFQMPQARCNFRLPFFVFLREQIGLD